MSDIVMDRRHTAAAQQPNWGDEHLVERIRAVLANSTPLVQAEHARLLRSLLARVAAGEAYVVQSGDCAEDPAESTPQHVQRKCAVLDLLAGVMRLATHKPVLRVGRIAGQFAKPRSRPVERIGGVDLPVYRGHMVNGPEPDAESRRPDPLRILTGYLAAREVMTQLGWCGDTAGWATTYLESPVWTSHEALLLDYELPMVRTLADGLRWLASTHWPWIGERTRQVDGPHVALLAEVANPIACKIGPTVTPDEISALCERLDPRREPGRLTLIARMGADLVADRLPRLVESVRSEGHPAIWLCDPMHGNTVVQPDGSKVRLMEVMAREVGSFRQVLTHNGGVAGGLHLETTPDDVGECVAAGSKPGARRTSFCDPRLNPEQAASIVSAWSAPQ
ncbi:MAG TPA: 3-deoxy-7-phosphoheptulonate synthase [Streptosporangiaceae bacterium]|jgi:3-deoxy-7-phosphoheptulonate synthase|nr:3-deoxy-7-phosphoheptulonate synthase [Streptosporangiaceae bacterium]